MGYGALGGVTGAAVGLSTAVLAGPLLAFGKNIIEELLWHIGTPLNVIKVDVCGFRTGLRDSGSIRRALTNLVKRDYPRMARFLADLHGEGITIKLWLQNQCQWDHASRTISWNQMISDMNKIVHIDNPPAWFKAHPEVILVHELSHGHHYIVEGLPQELPQGYQDWRHFVEYRAVGLGEFARPDLVSENSFRQLYGIQDLRPSYYPHGVPY